MRDATKDSEILTMRLEHFEVRRERIIASACFWEEMLREQSEIIADAEHPAWFAAGSGIRGEPFRGKFRKSFEKPEPFVPGQVEAVSFTMPDINHVFRRGHRVMVQVQSTWFPLVDRNPQKFCDIYQARAEDFQKATQRVYRSPQASSQVRVQVLAPAK